MGFEPPTPDNISSNFDGKNDQEIFQIIPKPWSKLTFTYMCVIKYVLTADHCYKDVEVSVDMPTL